VANGELADDLPVCEHKTYSAAEWSPSPEIPRTQCYDQKAYITEQTEFTNLNASFIVPPLPRTAVGQTVYLWPGFKATAPVIGRPVLQPVLQYGQTGGARWQLQSWAVGIPSGSTTAPAIDVREGDHLTTYMQLDGNTWTIYGRNDRTGQESKLRISKQTAGSQKYTSALFVSENVMARNHCDYYPTNTGVEFTDITVNGNPGGVHWQSAYDCGTPDCQQVVYSSDDGTSVRLTWNGADPPSPSPSPTPSPTPSPVPTPSPGCVDSDSASDCSYWKGQGYCSSSSQYHDYMKENCCHTCGFGEVQV